MHYNRFRHYDPAAGIFINQDPIGLAGGEKPSAYVLNPVGWIDPLGLAGTCPYGSGHPPSNNSGNKPKPVNLPSARKIEIDMEHIASGHMRGGSRVSPNKTLFPESMSESQVASTVRNAYRNAKLMETQGDRVRLRGNGIEMWVNKVTKTIETAYPF